MVVNYVIVTANGAIGRSLYLLLRFIRPSNVNFTFLRVKGAGIRLSREFLPMYTQLLLLNIGSGPFKLCHPYRLLTVKGSVGPRELTIAMRGIHCIDDCCRAVEC